MNQRAVSHGEFLSAAYLPGSHWITRWGKAVHRRNFFRPGIETTRLGEHNLRFGPLVSFAFRDNRFWNIVQKIRRLVELRAIAAVTRSRRPSGDRSGVVPPRASSLARKRDHRVDEHQHTDGNALADEWRCEASQRLRDEYRIPVPVNSFDNASGIRR